MPPQNLAKTAVVQTDTVSPRKRKRETLAYQQAPSDIKGLSWNRQSNKWRLSCYDKNIKKQVQIGNYILQEDAVIAYREFRDYGIKPPLRISSSIYPGINYNPNNMVPWQAAYNDTKANKKVYIGSFSTELEAVEARGLYMSSGVIPLRKYNMKVACSTVCPGKQNATVSCPKKTHTAKTSFHDIATGELLGVCCSKGCLDGRYQTPQFIEESKAKRTLSTLNEKAQTDVNKVAYRAKLNRGPRDTPFTKEDAKSYADVFFYGLIIPLLVAMDMAGFITKSAIGVQYTTDHRAKSEGSYLLGRVCVKEKLAKHGLITHASKDAKKPPEREHMVMITKVMASCNPGYSLIAWEKRLQCLCNKKSENGSLLGCCMMFGKTYNVGGATRYAYTNGVVGQVTVDFWVPKEWAVRVDEWCMALVAEMERQTSFPTILRGQFKNATNDPLKLRIPMKNFTEMIAAESDDELDWTLSFLRTQTKSVERVKACKEEKERRYWIEVERIGCIF